MPQHHQSCVFGADGAQEHNAVADTADDVSDLNSVSSTAELIQRPSRPADYTAEPPVGWPQVAAPRGAFCSCALPTRRSDNGRR